MAGWMKVTTPIAELPARFPWASAMSPALVRFIGACELMGAAGLLLPAVTRIKPDLTPLAALGLLTIMVLASAFHVSRGEAAQALPFNLTVAAVAAFVAWGRLKKAPIATR